MLVTVDLNEAELELINQLKEHTKVRTRSEILRRGIWTMKDIFLKTIQPASGSNNKDNDQCSGMNKHGNQTES